MSDNKPKVGTFEWATRTMDEGKRIAEAQRQTEPDHELQEQSNEPTVESLQAEVKELREEIETLRERLESLERWTHYRDSW